MTLTPDDWTRFLAAARGDLAVLLALGAMRQTERGGPGREMGVLAVPAATYDEQVRVTANSLRRHLVRFGGAVPARRAATGLFTDEFLRSFSARWAPLRAENDPRGLNVHHAKNLLAWYHRYAAAAVDALRGLL
jgi:hypothetical protein